MIDKIETGKLLKELKDMAGISIQDICNACDVSEVSVYKWFSGKCLPTLSHFFVLSKMFGCDIDHLVVRRNDGKA